MPKMDWLGTASLIAEDLKPYRRSRRIEILITAAVISGVSFLEMSEAITGKQKGGDTNAGSSSATTSE